MAKNCEHVFRNWDNIRGGAKCDLCGEYFDIDKIIFFAELYFVESNEIEELKWKMKLMHRAGTAMYEQIDEVRKADHQSLEGRDHDADRGWLFAIDGYENLYAYEDEDEEV